MKLKITTLSTWMLSILFSIQSFAQDGTLDPTFGVGGKSITDLGLESLNKIAIQADGKIIAIGSYNNGANTDFAIVRYKTNGKLDSSFSNDGIQFTDFSGQIDEATELAIQPDGKILVVGYTYLAADEDYALAKYNTDGTLDNAFGTNGKATIDIGNDYARSIKLLSDGKFYIVGTTAQTNNFVFLKCNSNGTLDLSFNTQGYVSTNLSGITIEPVNAIDLLILSDGKLMLCGSDEGSFFQKGIYIRYKANGIQDSTYGKNGVVFLGDKFISSATAYVNRTILVENDNLVSVLDYNGRVSLIKLNNAGKIDSTFGVNGIGRMKWGSAYGLSIAKQTDGKFICTGSVKNPNNSNIRGFMTCRFTSNGTIDSTFSNDGVDTIRFKYSAEEISDVKIQSDGKIIAAGKSISPTNNGEFALARYISALKVGILDFSSSEKNLIVSPNPIESESILEYSLDADVENLSIGLYDLQGKQLKTFMQGKSQLKGDYKEKITLPEGLAAGNYIIQISSPKGQYSVKVTH